MIDNAKFHKTVKTRELAEKAGCQLVFLPPYPPDLNPIENWRAIIKSKVKSVIDQFEDFN